MAPRAHRPLPAPPVILLELTEDRSPRDDGFLRMLRHRYVARYPDGSTSPPFAYDIVERRGLDAVVIAAHHLADGVRHVWLRSAVRPPLALRRQSPVPEPSSPSLWELPAGLVEPDEALTVDGVRAAAARELEEELGFVVSAGQLRRLGPSVFPAPALIAERHFFFEVEVDPAARLEPSLDGSALEHGGVVLSLPLADALSACAEGAIEDEKTELALRRLADRARDGWGRQTPAPPPVGERR